MIGLANICAGFDSVGCLPVLVANLVDIEDQIGGVGIVWVVGSFGRSWSFWRDWDWGLELGEEMEKEWLYRQRKCESCWR